MNPQDYGQNEQNWGGQAPNGQFSNAPQQNFEGQNFGQAPQNYGAQNGFSGQNIQPQFETGQIKQPVSQQNPQNQIPTHLLPNRQYNINQSENPYTVEYLNSIAPKEQEKFWTRSKIMLAAFIGVGLILSLGFLIFGNRGDSNNEAVTRVFYHIMSLEETAKKQQSRLKSSNLSALNAGLSISLSANKASMAEFMTSRKIEVLKDSKIKKSTLFEKVSKDYTKLDETLEEAFLKTTLDEVYSREMSYQLSVVKTNIEKLKKRLNSKKANKTLDEIIANFETSIKGLSEFKE